MAKADKFKPMLAASICGPSDSQETLEYNLTQLNYPVLATPKLDGIRCITMPYTTAKDVFCAPVCRSLKNVPNDYVRDTLAQLDPGLDGELMTYSERELFDNGGVARPRDFNAIQGDVMRFAGRPNFKFHVFDADVFGESNYAERCVALSMMELPDFCVKVLPTRCESIADLQTFMSKCIAEGHEGICFRSKLYAPYKHGRSTLKQQWLIKWKIFERYEARIIGFEEEMHNANEAGRNELGHQVRSSHQANMLGKNRLGALVCETADGIRFKMGTGFSADQRENMWLAQVALLGQYATYSCQTHGQKVAPRIPVFIAIRDRRDMS